MTCKLEKEHFDDYYDLKLLSQGNLPIDCLIDRVASQNLSEIGKTRSQSRIWSMFYDVTPNLVDAFQREARDHVKSVKENPSLYGYLYFVAENKSHWYNAPYFDYEQFPLMIKRKCVLNKIRKIAGEFSDPNTMDHDVACLYLIYFYALLANPHTNWITVDYIANGNRYHQFGTRLKGTMKTCVKKVWSL